MLTIKPVLSSLCMIGLAIMFFSTNTGLAQPPQGRGFGPPDSTRTTAMVDSLAKKLSLSKEQKDKVRKVYLAAFNETRKAFANNSGDFQAMRETRMKINEKRDADVKALLNDEQKKLYDKFLQEQREQMQRRMGGWSRPNN